MATLTLTARGQVTFRKEVLRHLGIKPGDRIQLDLMPDAKATVSAAKEGQDVSALFGLLAGKTTKVATLEEIDQAIADGWAGKI